MPKCNFPKMIKPCLAVILVLVSVLRPAVVQAAPAVVATGPWSGDHIVLDVSAQGAGVEFDCAHGQIVQPISIDPNGDFNVAGTFTPEHGGPVRRDEDNPPATARYSGHVEGDTMNLTIMVGKEKIGTFTLTRGAQRTLTKCR